MSFYGYRPFIGRNGPLKVDHEAGSVEGADLKNKSQSTTHVYPCRLDMEGAKIDWSKNDHVITLVRTTGTWTPVCLARVSLIMRDP